MDQMMIVLETAKTKPDYRKTAAALLERCREFYQDPENKRRLEEWREQKCKAKKTSAS